MRSLLYKIAKFPFFGRFMVKWKNPLPHEERKEWNAFELQSLSGGTIKGLWIGTATTPAGTIVLGHPMKKEAKGIFLKNYYQLYRNCGLNVVVFDFNGFGESSLGNFSFFKDIIAVGLFAKSTFKNLPLFYHGISLGGQMGIVAFAEQHLFDFAIVESAAPTLEEFWIKFPTAYRVLRIFNALMPEFAQQIRMIDRVKTLQGIKSLLLIYSENDAYTPAAMGKKFQTNSNVPTELWSVPDAEHANIIKSAHQEAYKKKIASFIHDCLHKENKTTTIGNRKELLA